RCGPAAPPLAGGVWGTAYLPGQWLVALAGRRREDDLDPECQRLRAGRPPPQRGQHRLLGRGDRDGEWGGAGGHWASYGWAAAATTSRHRPILAQPLRNFRDPVLVPSCPVNRNSVLRSTACTASLAEWQCGH